MFRLSLLFFALLSVAAPAISKDAPEVRYDPVKVAALQNLQILDQRLHNIGYRLVSANSAFCRDMSGRAGLQLHDIAQYGAQDIARHALRFNNVVAINAIAPASPAAIAGLEVGDGLFAINQKLVGDIDFNDPKYVEEPMAYRRIAAVKDALKQAFASGQTRLDIRRDAEQISIFITPLSVCTSDFQIDVSDNRNASTNGKMVSISSKLAEYFLDEDEFAAVVAHELAHNLLGHRERLNAQKVNRGFFGQFGKSAKRIKATEIEADRLSIWLMANAGYDPQAAIRFWTRYGKEHGKGIFSASTHYRWKKRVKLFQEEIAKMAAIKPVDRKRTPPLLIDPDA